MVAINITGTPMLLRRRLQRLILTGSTFGDSKFALTAIADALWESCRDRRLEVQLTPASFMRAVFRPTGR
jgi:hypothetical protein